MGIQKHKIQQKQRKQSNEVLISETDLKANKKISIKDKEQINYIVNVLRFKKGQEVIVRMVRVHSPMGSIALAHKKEVLIQTSEIEFP